MNVFIKKILHPSLT